jgi:hypothetical protein
MLATAIAQQGVMISDVVPATCRKPTVVHRLMKLAGISDAATDIL